MNGFKRPVKSNRRMHCMHGRGLDETARKGIAHLVKRATPQEEAHSRPLFAGEKHALLLSEDGKRYVPHGWSGPGTHVDKRLALGVKPVDQVDACSKAHDIAYNNLSKARKAGKITKEEHIKGVKTADDVFRMCSKKVTDRPKLAKLAGTLIATKGVAEDVGVISREKFSGVGDGPTKKLMKNVNKALSQGSMIVQCSNEEDEQVCKKGRHSKIDIAGLTKCSMQGGFPPVLVAIAGSVLAGLASKAVEKLIDHFTEGNQTGKGKATKKKNIQFLLENVDPQKLINAVDELGV